LTAVGFGSTEYALNAENDEESWILKKVSLQSDSTLSNDCYTDVICTIGDANGYARGDTCTRDSGGPVYGYIKSRYFYFGVISRGIDCGGVNSYSYNIYTVYFLDWIESQIGSSFLCDLR
jgi:secreted trypsin-like serine protease